MYLFPESCRQRIVVDEFDDDGHSAHEVAVVMAMVIIIAEHPTMIPLADKMVNVSEVVSRNHTVTGPPNFLPQPGATPGPLQPGRLIDDFFPTWQP